MKIFNHVQIKVKDLYLEQAVPEETYTSKNKDLQSELAKVITKQEIYKTADNDFKTTLITAFKLACRASGLFESSKTNEKRELINFVFSHLTLAGQKLDFTLRAPFNMMVNFENCAEWLLGPDSNQRPNG